MANTTENADLSGLRINRSPEEGPPSRFINWKILLASVVVVLIVGGYFAVQGSFSPAREVDLATATFTFPSQASAVLTASGYVVAQQKAAVASKGTGRLVYLGVEEGDHVTAGQVIARLEDQDMMAALDKANADLRVALADSFDAQQSLDRQVQLFKSSLSAKSDLDAAQARYHRVVATIQSARAAVSGADVGVENTRIRAPFNGTVLTKDANVGEVVSPFAASVNSRAAVVSIADMTSLQVEADVSESNIPRVSVDQACEIVLDAYPEKRYRGAVHKIVPTADRAKATVLTKVAFTDRDSHVLPEMSAKVTFLSKEADSATLSAPARLTVPASCVVTRGGAPAVLLVRDSRVVETPVKTGAASGDRIEVNEGVVQGDKLILRPEQGLTTGSRVKVRGN